MTAIPTGRTVTTKELTTIVTKLVYEIQLLRERIKDLERKR